MSGKTAAQLFLASAAFTSARKLISACKYAHVVPTATFGTYVDTLTSTIC